jgi:hypothetical protein
MKKQLRYSTINVSSDYLHSVIVRVIRVIESNILKCCCHKILPIVCMHLDLIYVRSVECTVDVTVDANKAVQCVHAGLKIFLNTTF